MNYFLPLCLTLLTSPWLRRVAGETTAIPVGDCVGRDEELRTTVSTLARQMMLQQLFVEEKSRADGDSGLKAEKVRYTAYHGSKDNGENLAYLPTTIIGFNETTGTPVFAQFNYRILCHPIHRDIPLSYFRPSGDLHYRFAVRDTYEDYQKLRSARFTLSQYSQRRFHRWDLLDDIMRYIPGKDNYLGSQTDNTFGLSTNDVFTGQTLNSAFYHRWYLMNEPGAMGTNIGHRGFNDRNLFVAENTRPGIAGVTYNYCQSDDNCQLLSKKVSYAFPLEVIYMTPLQRWNPYNITFKGNPYRGEGLTVREGGRNGGFTTATAFNGNNANTFYRLPAKFFSNGNVNSDAADTLDDFVGVLDPTGTVQNVTASGIRIHLPSIPGVPGNVRIRYPIMPIYAEGSTIWKELEALREMVMDIQGNREFFEVDPGLGGEGGDGGNAYETVLWTPFSQSETRAIHRHAIEFTDTEIEALSSGQTISRTTSVADGHAHVFNFHYVSDSNSIQALSCDGRTDTCWDGHTFTLTIDPDYVAEHGLPDFMT